MVEVLIADSLPEFGMALEKALPAEYQVSHCRTGKQTLDFLRRHRPDLLVLDLMLAELDGISLLQFMTNEGIRLPVLATTYLVNEYIIRSAAEFGVGYLIRKPCDIAATAARIEDLWHKARTEREQPLHQPQTQVTKMLLELGICAKHKGFAYLQEAVVRMAQSPQQSVTKELYPSIADGTGNSAMHVERCIRTAIEAAWKHGNRNQWDSLFPGNLSGTRPSNASFISVLAQELLPELQRMSDE